MNSNNNNNDYLLPFSGSWGRIHFLLLPCRSFPNTRGKKKKKKRLGSSRLGSARLSSPSEMNGGPSGFHNAPVAKTLVVATALFTVPFGIQGRSLKLGLSYEDVYQKLQIWKLISSVFAFKSTPELICGLSLLYYFRVFERQIGSNKYSVFILFSVAVPLLFQILALGYLKDPSLNPLASGPYGLIFASYVPFFFDIPISLRFRIFGLHLSDKSFIYLAGLQFPDVATSIFSRLSWPSPNNSSQASSGGGTIGNMPSYTGRQVEGNYPSTAYDAIPEPLETSIAMLVSMGFDRDSARLALMQSRNDINVATNILLESQSR